MDTFGFTLRPFPRGFQLIGRQVGSMTRALYVYERPFSTLPDDPDTLVLPLLEADRRAGGAYIGSQPVATDLPLLAFRGSILRYAPMHFTRRLLRRTGTFSEFLQTMPGHTRQRLGRKARKILALGGSDAFRVYQSPDEIEEFLRLAQELAPRTYQARLLDAQFLATEEANATVMAWAREGHAVAMNVVIDGRAAAFHLFRLHPDGVLEGICRGYDTAYAKLSVGLILDYFYFERCFFSDERVTFLDWTEGDAENKRLFSNHSVRCAELFYLRLRAAPLSLLAADASIGALRAASRPAIAALRRGGYAGRVRRWLRRPPDVDDSPE